MYYIPWTILVIISLWVSVVGFIWAWKSGQFSEQDRARYLPLRGEDPSGRGENPGKLTVEVYALLAILGIGGTILLTVLIWTLGRMKGG